MSMEAKIAILLGILLFVILNLLLDFMMGDRGREGQIKKHYLKLKGEQQVKIEVTGVIAEVGILNQKKYKKIALWSALGLFVGTLYTFGSIFVTLFLSAGAFYIPRILRNRDEEKRKELISIQFRDALNSIMSSLKSGLSLNSALIKTPEDLEKIHNIYKDKVILLEFRKIKNDLSMGIPMELVLNSFKEHLKFEEVTDFVNSISILKKKGGNLVEVMEKTISMIVDKMALKSEIKILTAQKKAEAKLLTFLPIALVTGMSLFMTEYMEPLFKTFTGQILALLAFVMLLINYFIGKKITNIEV